PASPTPEIYTLSLHDALPILTPPRPLHKNGTAVVRVAYARRGEAALSGSAGYIAPEGIYFISEARWYPATGELDFRSPVRLRATDRKSTRLNSSHVKISYAVF